MSEDAHQGAGVKVQWNAARRGPSASPAPVLGGGGGMLPLPAEPQRNSSGASVGPHNV